MTDNKHEVVVITTFGVEAQETLVRLRETMPVSVQHFFVGPIEGFNSYASFAFMPDGATEAPYGFSTEMDVWRAKLIELLHELRCAWVDVVMTNEAEEYWEDGVFHPFVAQVVAHSNRPTPPADSYRE